MAEELQVQCAIAGGGPAGLMLGYLLSRAGVRVLVLEKHKDFLRDFRGDTIHPSTLEVMRELGLLDRLLELPHYKVRRLSGQFGGEAIELADFSRLPVAAKFIAMMPQWDFLNFVAREGETYPGFSIHMHAEATDLLRDGGRVTGLRATTPSGPLAVRADLVVGADGRNSVLRDRSGLEVETVGAPIDVLWFRLPRRDRDTEETQGRFDTGSVFVMLNRGDFWQCAFVIAKGSLERLKEDGLPAFRNRVGRMLPFDASRAGDIGSWDDVKLLTVKIDRLKSWAMPGLLFIGDAAHAMSPVGGVGINLAIQDAVAAANILARPLAAGRLGFKDLEAVQRRRQLPTRLTQAMQVLVQDTVIKGALDSTTPFAPPLAVRLITRTPGLKRIPARLIGLGARPEHVAGFIRGL